MDRNCTFLQISNVSFFGTSAKFGLIPENLCINVAIFTVIISVFLILRAVAWAERKRHRVSSRKGSSTTSSPMPSDVDASTLTSEASIPKSILPSCWEMSWTALLYNDVFEIISPADLKMDQAVYRQLDTNMSFCQMIWHSFFNISDDEILGRCRFDGLQYLRFIKRLIYYSMINTFVCIFVILPVNYQGTNTIASGDYFPQTTLINLNARSRYLWVHVFALLFLYIACFFNTKKVSEYLVIPHNGTWTERTVFVKGLRKKDLTSEKIEEFFKTNFRDMDIEDVKLIYSYEPLLIADKDLRYAKENLQYVGYIKFTKLRDVKMKESCWCCFYCCGHYPCGTKNMRDADEYYQEDIVNKKIKVINKLNKLPLTIQTAAFVTFSTKYEAERAVTDKKALFRLPNMKSDVAIKKAPNPADIIWENIGAPPVYKIRTIIINSAVFLVAFFLTTPAIILSSLNFNNISEALASQSIFIITFLPTLLVLILSVSIPSLVIYSSGYLLFRTKSSMYVSIMKKSITFLLFTVVILPSLGLTSISAFFMWTLSKKNNFYDFQCIFLPDNGAFFVGYVMTSCFIGTAFQLIRLPEVLFCFIYALLAKSEAEKAAIRKENIYEFAFGVQYTYVSLVFTLVSFYSILCPIMAPFGLIYFLLKLRVDEYNMIFCSYPSTISHKVHNLAINYILIVMILKIGIVWFFFFVRGGWTGVTSATCALLLFSVLICIINMTKFLRDYIPEIFLLPHLRAEKRKKNVYLNVQRDSKEVFQPYVLLKYLGEFKLKDKYNNPMPCEDGESVEEDENFPNEL